MTIEQELRHNFELFKSNAKVYMYNYRTTGSSFYLNYAISETCKSLQYLKRIKLLKDTYNGI